MRALGHAGLRANDEQTKMFKVENDSGEYVGPDPAIIQMLSAEPHETKTKTKGGDEGIIIGVALLILILMID